MAMLKAALVIVALASVGQALTIHAPTGQTSSSLQDSQKSTEKTQLELGVKAIPKVFPVPTSSRCIVIMICQYMIIFTALALCRSYHELTGVAKGPVEAALRGAVQTVTYGPMLCTLFIACRMRVEFLSDGKGQPQNWVQNCMYAVTFAVMGSTFMVLLIPLVTGKSAVVNEETGDLEGPTKADAETDADHEQMVMELLHGLSAVRYLILLGLYGGLVGVIVGTCTYLPEGETDLTKLPAPATSIVCTMILAVIFFMAQIVIAVCRSYTEFTGADTHRLMGVMHSAAATVEFAPMLSILFLAARMHALQHDGQPQAWSQHAMRVSTNALCLSTIMAVVVPLMLGGKTIVNTTTKEATFEVPNPTLSKVCLAARYVAMVCFYGGAAAVAASIFLFEAPAGPKHTLPVSPTVQCVVNLSMQFFVVYFALHLMVSVSELSGGKYNMQEHYLFHAVDAAKTTVALAPMLAILFVTTRMYALLITDNKGAPQAWVQDGMFMCSWALFVSFMMCLVTGMLMKVEVDADGNVTNEFSNKFVGIAMTVIRYLTMLLLYGGIVTVITGLFSMTPETANGRGSVPIVSDAINATPIGHSPPGPVMGSF